MKQVYRFFLTSFIILLTSGLCLAQTSEFNLQAYKTFLSSHQDMTASQLYSMYPTGKFQGNLNFDFASALYHDSISNKYNLTNGEKSLIAKNGFMVTERCAFPDFISAFRDIYAKDLPVFITTDAVLDAIHRSYDNILTEVEMQVLIPRLTDFLDKLHAQLPALASDYLNNPKMNLMLRDLDFYLTVARTLLEDNALPHYSENTAKVSEMLQFISTAKLEQIQLFSETLRFIDFSQFTPRGHYSRRPELTKYFKTMMWLGRIEIYLIAPRAINPSPSFSDLQRQTILANLVNEAIAKANLLSSYQEINGILEFFVGESDNVTIPNLISLKQLTQLKTADELLDSVKFVSYQDTLKNKSFAFQRILSQVIETGFNSPDSIIPASSFLLLGQRFIIDSYITSQVVFDKINYQNFRYKRMLPSSLDVLFALGNDASVQLLKKELEEFHYETNLASLRYLVDSYDENFWKVSLYNLWLNSIRKLNPKDRSKLPQFMQTGAWWQEKMNTQLASWAQLRHDNILYAKQSYSGMPGCSFPYAYVEPFPEFFSQVKLYAEIAKTYFSGFTFKQTYTKDQLLKYFAHLSGVCDTLSAISQKELDNTPLSDSELKFLKSTINVDPGVCAPDPRVVPGWYDKLVFHSIYEDFRNPFLVADFHTSPADKNGEIVGWVLHAATGRIDLGVFTVKSGNSSPVAYVGPVLSYYEHLTSNFKRLTDDEWANLYSKAPSPRPGFVNSYLANSFGEVRPEGVSLATSVDPLQDKNRIPESMLLINNYPNPFNSSTLISFTIPYSLSLKQTKLIVYDLQGKIVKELINEPLPAGNYLSRWNGTDNSGKPVTSGVYFYNLSAGDQFVSGKMSLIK
ncbi:MAG: DUF3160 domain-containing protein [Bacillota bacterium]